MDETLQQLVDEWFHYQFVRGWDVMAVVCYIAAHNYYVYAIVKEGGRGNSST